MLQKIREAIRDDYLAVAGLLVGAGQFGIILTLFDLSTSSGQVYSMSLVAFVLMVFFAWRHFHQAKREHFHPEQVRTHRRIFTLYVALALIAVLPAAYRAMYVHTTWLIPDQNDGSAPYTIGQTSSLSLISVAQAATGTAQLKVNASLDTSRTSVRCLEAPATGASPEEVFAWGVCTRFGIPDAQMRRFLLGWKADYRSNDEGRRDFEAKYFKSIILPARKALRTVPRLSKNPLIENVEAWVFFANDFSWKQRLFKENLFPTAGEWTAINREAPIEARALRRYLTELIGVFDPIFSVSIENTSGSPIELSSITYTAKHVSTSKAELLSGFERPRYIIELREGSHTEPLNPPIVIPPKSITSFDVLVTLQEVRPGSEFEVDLAFGTREKLKAVALPKTQIVFFRGKAP